MTCAKGGIILISSFEDIKRYKEILKLLKEQLQVILESAEENLAYWESLLHKDAPKDITAIYLDGMPKSTYNAISLDRIVKHINDGRDRINDIALKLNRLEQLEKAILEEVYKFDRLDFKVVYLRDITGLKISEIADTLGYSEQYIKEISAKNKTYFLPTDSIEN